MARRWVTLLQWGWDEEGFTAVPFAMTGAFIQCQFQDACEHTWDSRHLKVSNTLRGDEGQDSVGLVLRCQPLVFSTNFSLCKSPAIIWMPNLEEDLTLDASVIFAKWPQITSLLCPLIFLLLWGVSEIMYVELLAHERCSGNVLIRIENFVQLR